MKQEQQNDILRPGETCWRVAHADRAAVLIDGARYYEALRASLLKAQRRVFIVGWDIDSRTRLVGPSGSANDGLPERLGDFLTELVTRRPALKVHILLWDYTMLYALDREPLPSINLAWKTPPQISVCLDDVLPVGASHHQKIVVIDDTVAFCGGLDLTSRRWDTSQHRAGDTGRIDPAGAPYRPFHDIQMMVDGPAAQCLGRLVRERWRNAACETLPKPAPQSDPWPERIAADFTDIGIGIARTRATYDGNAEIREVEALFNQSIAMAERSIYIECQYLTADRVGEQLARRMQENKALEVLIVSPNVHQSWLEEHSMNTGRRRFMARLEEAGVQGRVRMLYPSIPDDASGEGVMVHAKFMIVDDRFLRVGSANLNNRSMGMDTECDLALEAAEAADRRTITRLRNRLMAEHLGVTTGEVEAALCDHAPSFLAAVDSLRGGERTLKPIDISIVPDDELTRTVSQLADPERPVATPAFMGDMFGGETSNRPARRATKLAVTAISLIALIFVWRYSSLSDYTNPVALAGWLRGIAGGDWMPVVMPIIYIIGGLTVFPVTALIVVTSMMFNPAAAVAYALGGSLMSAAVTFALGHGMGRGPLRNLVGPRVNRVSRRLARQGVLSVAALRIVPIAPFTIINIVAGASHIRFIDFLLGTLAGMAPGILVICFLGHQLIKTLKSPNGTEILMLVLGMLVWLTLSVALQWLAAKLGRDTSD